MQFSSVQFIWFAVCAP